MGWFDYRDILLSAQGPGLELDKKGDNEILQKDTGKSQDKLYP
jgi:hypothetical protein